MNNILNKFIVTIQRILKTFKKTFISRPSSLSGSLWDIDLALQGHGQLIEYKGKVKAVLIINTATGCGLHKQLSEIQELHEKYAPLGLLIIGIPSDSFLDQEPLNDDQLPKYCQIHYGLNIPMALKTHITGTHQHSLYKWLSGYRLPLWNYHKYLFNSQGDLVQDFSPITSVQHPKVHKAIEDLIKQKNKK